MNTHEEWLIINALHNYAEDLNVNALQIEYQFPRLCASVQFTAKEALELADRIEAGQLEPVKCPKCGGTNVQPSIAKPDQLLVCFDCSEFWDPNDN